jgi:restriction system protein
MADNQPTDVLAAFEMLLEEVEEEIEFTNQQGSAAFSKGNYEQARSVLERAAQLTGFRAKLAELRKEWQVISPPPPAATAASASPVASLAAAEQRTLSRLQRGLRTSEVAFYRPILQALSDMDGSGKMSDVLDRVGPLMQDVLRDVDHLPLQSEPDSERWRNTAQWARSELVKRGLIKPDSPRGFWEISEAGRQWLAQADSQPTLLP